MCWITCSCCCKNHWIFMSSGVLIWVGGEGHHCFVSVLKCFRTLQPLCVSIITVPPGSEAPSVCCPMFERPPIPVLHRLRISTSGLGVVRTVFVNTAFQALGVDDCQLYQWLIICSTYFVFLIRHLRLCTVPHG